MPARIIALGLVLGLAACDNRDEEFEREVRGICDSIVPGTTTLREGSVMMGVTPLFIPGACRSDLEPLSGQTCEVGTSVCQLRWQFRTGDCGPGGCTVACDVRVADEAGGAPPDLDATICARRFLTQQPFVF